MRIRKVKIENFRAHTSTDIPLTQLGSIIGENNAGKSTVLHAIQFALDDRKLDDSDFRDANTPVTVTLEIEDIKDSDLKRVGETHREKVAGMVSGGRLTVVRSQSLGGKADAQYTKMVPIDERWSLENLNVATKGKTGAKLLEAAIELRPELDTILNAPTSKAKIVEAWSVLNAGLPMEELQPELHPYPTGISTAIKPFFPSVIYIESVKDAATEAKATGSSAFAKLLGLLFEEVQEQFDDIEAKFNAVHQKLNRVFDDNGSPKDLRIPAVKRIESVIEQFVTASFPGVKVQMDIPAPSLNMLLSSADLFIDDGHISRVSSKGDGLKRSVLFALLRAYADIRDNGLALPRETSSKESAQQKTGISASESKKRDKRPYLLLFEEPELYLHPRAQRQLMSALEEFAKEHQVLVTTHSPGFFQPGTQGFTRLHKKNSVVVARPVELTLTMKDAYQVVRHENNEAAFFAHRVVLVEGDSDTFVYPHLARLFSADWSDIERNIMFVKIGGKGNVSRYRKFFSHFDVPIHVITDLDALSNGFEHLTSTESIREARGALISAVKNLLEGPSEPRKEKLKEIVRSRTPRMLWQSAQENLTKWQAGKTEESAKAIVEDLELLFDKGNGDAVLAMLKTPPSDEIRDQITQVISALAEEDTHILQGGDLEDYCLTHASSDKVETAIRFCANTTSLSQFEDLHGDAADSVTKELGGIFARIFRESEPIAL